MKNTFWVKRTSAPIFMQLAKTLQLRSDRAHGIHRSILGGWRSSGTWWHYPGGRRIPGGNEWKKKRQVQAFHATVDLRLR